MIFRCHNCHLMCIRYFLRNAQRPRSQWKLVINQIDLFRFSVTHPKPISFISNLVQPKELVAAQSGNGSKQMFEKSKKMFESFWRIISKRKKKKRKKLLSNLKLYLITASEKTPPHSTTSKS